MTLQKLSLPQVSFCTRRINISMEIPLYQATVAVLAAHRLVGCTLKEVMLLKPMQTAVPRGRKVPYCMIANKLLIWWSLTWLGPKWKW